MNSLLLDRTLWDICLDGSGNIAVASAPYAIAQDVACAVRLFRGELWYNTTPGVPYFEEILGRAPPLGVMKAAIIKAALTVPLVATVKVFISAAKNREIIGQIQVTDTGGTASVLTGRLSSPVPA
jgi:hypothetical protein